MSKQVNVYEAKTKLSQLIDEAAAGEEIVIARHGRPVAKLVALDGRREPRKPGGLEGKIWISDDFDDPLPDDIQKYFDGKGD